MITDTHDSYCMLHMTEWRRVLDEQARYPDWIWLAHEYQTIYHDQVYSVGLQRDRTVALYRRAYGPRLADQPWRQIAFAEVITLSPTDFPGWFAQHYENDLPLRLMELML